MQILRLWSRPPLNGSKVSLLIKTTDDKTPILFHSLRLTEEEAKGKDSYEQTRMLFDKYLKTHRRYRYDHGTQPGKNMDIRNRY